MVDTALGSNKDIIDTCEKIRAILGVDKVRWYELVQVLGYNKELDLEILAGSV